MKKPDLKDDDGEPAATASVQQALLGAWGDADATDMSLNEFAYTEKKLMIPGMPDRLTFMEGKTIQQVAENAEEKEYTIVQQIAEVISENETKLSTSQRKIVAKKGGELFGKPASQDALVAMSSGDVHTMEAALPLSIETLQSLLFACVRDTGWDVECFNLTTWEETEPLPPQVGSRPGCEGLADCRWRKKVVRFDLVLDQLDSDTNTRVRSKAIYTIKMSPDAPFMSRITDFCYNGLATVGNAKIPVTLCQSILNFRRGAPETP
jgi:hypothetical protein